MKAFIFTIICCSVISYSIAQEETNYIPPSPETAALFKYQDYPVEYSTGLPQISIPIFEVKSGSLSVPISISYHASGFKVSDRNGPIASGWSLNAGGMVSRTVHGSPDFGEFPYPDELKVDNLSNLYDLDYFERIAHFNKNSNLISGRVDWLDSEYDIFSYNLGSLSGKFIFKDEAGTKTPVTIPYKPIKITHTTNGSKLTMIEILDDVGTYYKFVGGEFEVYSNPQATTGYLLKEIISADKSDTISFVHSAFVQERITRSQKITLIDQIETTIPSQISPDVDDENDPTSRNTYQISRLKEIHFKQGKVVFNLVKGGDLVDNIQIVNVHNEIIRTIKFSRSPLHRILELGYSTYKLNDISYQDKSGEEYETYSFEYYPTKYVGNNNYINYRHIDWWGYYNASGQHEMIPYQENISMDFQSIGSSNAKREPDLEALKSGVLRKIIYPTKGSIEFFYENNKYMGINHNPGQINKGPGLRIAQTKANDGNGNILTRSFKYGINEAGYGFLELEPLPSYMKTQNFFIYYATIDDFTSPHRYRKLEFYSDFLPQLSELAARPVIYTEVTEFNGTYSANIGKTVYEYDRQTWGPGGMGPQKWHIPDYNYWENSSLIKQTEFKNEGGAYEKVKSTSYTYSSETTENIYGLHLQQSYFFPQDALVREAYGHHLESCAWFFGLFNRKCEFLVADSIIAQFYPEEFAVQKDVPIYNFYKYNIQVGSKLLMIVKDTLFHDDGSKFSTSTHYEYNRKKLIQKTTSTSSDNKEISTEIYYPFDSLSNPIHAQMSDPSVNMVNVPVEQNEFRDGQPVKSVKTIYEDWGEVNPMIAPQWVQVKQQGAVSYENRIRYHAYDSDGNPASVSKEKDRISCYIWGYNQSLPVAKIDNISIDDIPRSIVRNIENHAFTNSSASADIQADVNFLLNQLGALMNNSTYMVTFYTYDPLSGMTSQTDPNGLTTYFEYDDAGRLRLIRDHHGDVLKTFKYNYQEN